MKKIKYNLNLTFEETSFIRSLVRKCSIEQAGTLDYKIAMQCKKQEDEKEKIENDKLKEQLKKEIEQELENDI